jgi:hypothetical protein
VSTLPKGLFDRAVGQLTDSCQMFILSKIKRSRKTRYSISKTNIVVFLRHVPLSCLCCRVVVSTVVDSVLVASVVPTNRTLKLMSLVIGPGPPAADPQFYQPSSCTVAHRMGVYVYERSVEDVFRNPEQPPHFYRRRHSTITGALARRYHVAAKSATTTTKTLPIAPCGATS